MAFYTTSSQSMMMNGASARQAASASCAYSTEMSRASMMNIALILTPFCWRPLLFAP